MTLASALMRFSVLGALYIRLSSKIPDKDTERGVCRFSRVVTARTKRLVLRFSRLSLRLECFCAHVPAN